MGLINGGSVAIVSRFERDVKKKFLFSMGFHRKRQKTESAGGQLRNKSSSSVPVTDSIVNIFDSPELVKSCEKKRVFKRIF